MGGMTTNPPINLRNLTRELARDVAPINKSPEYIAFGGGGATAFAELGVFNALDDGGATKNLKGIAGTSAGAMMGGLIALGYRGKELEPLTVDQDFGYFTSFQSNTEKWHLIGNMLGPRQGIFTGNAIGGWMEHAIAQRLGKPDMSFEELAQWQQEAQKSTTTGNLDFFEKAYQQAKASETKFNHQYSPYINTPDHQFHFDFNNACELRDNVLKTLNFHVVASEVIEKDGKTSFKPTVFDANNPELKSVPIARAVQASASFPYVFARQKINGKYYTDGGVSNNIPIEVFDGPDGKANPNAIAIGVNYVPLESVEGAGKSREETFRGAVNFRNNIPLLNDWKVKETEEIFARHMNSELLDKRDTSRMILVDVEGIGYTDFNLSPQKKLAAIGIGYQRGHDVLVSEQKAPSLDKQQLAGIVQDLKPHLTAEHSPAQNPFVCTAQTPQKQAGLRR